MNRAQNKAADSLKRLLSSEIVDTSRRSLLVKLIMLVGDKEMPEYNHQLKSLCSLNLKKISPNNIFYVKYKKGYAIALNNEGFVTQTQGKIKEAAEIYSDALKIMEEINDQQGIAYTLNSLGYIFHSQGNITKALYYYNRSGSIAEKIQDKKAAAQTYNNIGGIYKTQGNIARAIEYYSKCLNLFEQTNDKKSTAQSLTNFGAIYFSQGENDKAMEYYNRGLKILEEIGERQAMASALNNIGAALCNQGQIKPGISFFSRSLKIREEIGDKHGIANSLNNIAAMLYKSGDEVGALENFNLSLKISAVSHDKPESASSLNGLAAIYTKQKKYDKAKNCASEAMQLSKELGFPSMISNTAKKLVLIYKSMGNHKLALENYELFIQMRDSINNESTRKASIKSHLKYEYEKQAAADSVAHMKDSEIKNAQLQKQNAEIKNKKNQQYALFGGLLLVTVFAGFMYNRFKITQKQKSIIEKQKFIVEGQKKLVEEKQKEILDSIRYAKRIQSAHLPNENFIEKIMLKLRNCA